MACSKVFSEAQNRIDSETVKGDRVATYADKLFLFLVAIGILIVSLSCISAPIEEPPALQQPGVSEPNAIPTSEPVAMEQISYITAEELLQKIESQADVLVIDVRYDDYHETDRTKGAISIPFAVIAAREFMLPSTNEVVFYCGCPNEETSTLAARELIKQGFSGIKVLKGGIRVWSQKGYPTEPGY